MKALIRAYTANNLGDDLFVYLLINNFPYVKFYTDNGFDYNSILEDINNYRALPIIHNVNFNKLNKVLRFIYSIRIRTTVEIGGSIFIFPEATQQILKRLEKPNKRRYFILGANFGPYRDEEDRLLALKLFRQVNSIVFREKYSYDLFPELNNSDYAADMVFSYQPKVQSEQKDQVVITVVDYERFENGEAYIRILVELAKHYMSKNKKVILFSFCKAEGDNKTIIMVQKRLRKDKTVNFHYFSTHTHKKLKTSLNILQESQTIIASRFHAMILGWVLRKQTIVLPYSSKFTNVIRDFFPEQTYFPIESLVNVNIEDIVNGYFVADKKRLREYKNDALKHFAKLKEYFKE